MKGDDGAVEKELAGTVGDNGGSNECLPGTHAFPRSRRPGRPTVAAVSLRKKPAKRNARPATRRWVPPSTGRRDRTIGQGRERRRLAMAWQRAAAAPGPTAAADRE